MTALLDAGVRAEAFGLEPSQRSSTAHAGSKGAGLFTDAPCLNRNGHATFPLSGIVALYCTHSAAARPEENARPREVHLERIFLLLSRGNGFTMLELAIVIAILAVLMAITAPQILRARMQANETHAIGSLRAVATAQILFQSARIIDVNADGVGDYGTLGQLVNPGSGYGPFIDTRLGAGVSRGYAVSVNVTLGSAEVAAAFTANADPLVPGRTGVRRFYVDDSNILRYTSNGSPADADSPPL